LLRHRSDKTSAMMATPPRWNASGVERRLPFRPDQNQHCRRFGLSGKSPTTPNAFQPRFPPQANPILHGSVTS
jgi:hypothetical protein